MKLFKIFKQRYIIIAPLTIFRVIKLCRLYFKNHDTYRMYKSWGAQKKKYGKLHPDKTFYILRKHPEKMGLLSCYLTYLGQLELIANKKYIPVVDMMSSYYPLAHNLAQDANRVNAWEQYFDQVSDYNLRDVYNSRHVILGLGYTTENVLELFNGTALNDDLILKWHTLDKRYMKLNDKLKEQFQKEHERLFGTKRIIGVTIRETYTKIYQFNRNLIKTHPVQPEIGVVIQDLHKRLNEWNCDYLFISTESIQTLDIIIKEFGDKILYTKRIRRDNSSKNFDDYLNKSKRYISSMTVQQRHVDYLKEVYLLSRCTCLVSGKSSASVVASIWNGNKYEHRYFYNLGIY